MAALQRRAIRAHGSDLESAISTVRPPFLKLSKMKGVNTESHSESLAQFQSNLDAIKDFFAREDFTQPFLSFCDGFIASFTDVYRPIFLSARTDPTQLNSLIESLERAILEIRGTLKAVLDMLVFPAEVGRLSQKIAALRTQSDPESDISHKSHFLTSLQSVLTEIRSIAESTTGRTSKRLTAVAQTLDDLQSEWTRERRELQDEIDRSRGIVSLLNKCHGDRKLISAEEMSALSQEQLIAIIQNCRDVFVPIELRLLEGAPREFRELSQKYRTLAEYAERSYADAGRLNVAVAELKAENEALTSELEALNGATEIQEELEGIEERRRAIEASSKPAKHASEMDKLASNRADLKERLAGLANADLRRQIAALRAEIRDLTAEHVRGQEDNERMRSALNSLSTRTSTRSPK
jgi:chromosome segregation ATPase